MMVIMEYRSSLQLVAMFFGLLCLESVGYIMGGSIPINVQCIDSEQEALLRFKKGLFDHSDRLSSWDVVEEADCCKWRGVKCNHTTGHVMALDLHTQRTNESLQGELNCSALLYLPHLTYLDLSLNEFKQIHNPKLIGSLSNLEYLNLSNVNFRGNIPSDLGNLSLNHISGTIPRCINNIMGMVKIDDYDPFPGQAQEYYDHDVSCRIDLSSNDLSGEIPREITSLVGLKSLNLSNNHLTGVIPRDIGALKLLEWLDLSRNKLSCSIPTTISELHSLEYLNVSHNNLSGKIPLGNGKVTFNETSFLENQNLCGPPLVNDCLSNETYHEDDALCRTSTEENEGSEDENGDGHETTSVFYISMAVGFVTAYCGFWSALLFISSWRHAYYRFLDNLYDKIYVMVAVNVNILCSKFQSN